MKLAIFLPLLFASVTFAAAADLDTVRDRLVASMLPKAQAAQQQVIRQAKSEAASMNAAGTWDDIDYKDEQRSAWPAQRHLDRTLLMARAFRLSRDATFRDKALIAIDYWLAHDYHNPNWWHNEIGVPQLLGQTTLLLQGEMKPPQIEAVTKIMRRSVWTKWTGQNLAWGVTNQIMRGLIENDADAIKQAYERLYDEVKVTTKEGIQPDFSFHQHGDQFYSGGYGLAFAQDVSRYVGFSWGTQWQIPGDKMRIVLGYLLDGEQWMMHRDRFDYAATGREITRKGKTAVPQNWTLGPISPVGASYALLNSVSLLADQPVPRRDELLAWAARMAHDPSAKDFIGNKSFWCSDYMAHHRPGWFASVRMFSDRLLNSEIVNSEGLKSHHLADGMNLLYLNGNEYFDIFPVWDWTKIPGTTAEQGSLDIEGEKKPVGTKGRTSFVGGVSDGTHGVAAMDLARGKLVARKAWFFFDTGYVCLGAGITSDSDRGVVTSINQCNIDGTIQGERGWYHHANVGYVFRRDAAVKLTTGEQEGRWSEIGTGSNKLVKQRVFNLWIDHGSQPRDRAYEYAVLPGASAEQTRAYEAKPTMRVIENSANAQAVKDESSGVIGVVFWSAGKVGGIEVDRPCVFLFDGAKVTVANPEQQPIEINATINGTKLHFTGVSGAGSSRALQTTPAAGS